MLTTEQSALAPTDAHWTERLPIILLAAIFSAAGRGIRDNTHNGSLFVDRYWVGFWVTNYQDGYRRRALLGSIARLLQPQGVSVVWINLAAFALLGVLLALFVRSFLRLTSGAHPRRTILAFALFASAIVTIYFDILGDTLQVAFALFALIAIVPAARLTRDSVKLALALAGVALGFFIHEASLFFLVPCIPFLIHRRPRLRDFVVPTLFMGVLLALSIHWSALQTQLTYHALSLPRGHALEEFAKTPSFGELFQEEVRINLGTPRDALFLLIKLGSVVSLGVAAFVAIGNSFTPTAFRRTLQITVVILVYSAPLWTIAHDWGRFLAYAVLLATIVAGRWTSPAANGPATPAQPAAPSAFARLATHLQPITRFDSLQCAAFLLLIASPYDQSRIFGLHIRDFLSALAILALGLIAAWQHFASLPSVTTHHEI